MILLNLSIGEACELIAKGPKVWNAWRKKRKGYYPVLDGIELLDLDLSGIDFSGVSLRGAIINRCDLTAASLISALLQEANLQNNNLTRARMIAANLSEADLSGSVLTKANILTTNVRGARLDKIDFRGHDLQGLDLRNVSLKGADLSDQLLTRSDLCGAKLDKCRFDNTDLSSANLSEASLVGVDFRKTNLRGANFRKANLTKANFAGNHLEETLFDEAILRGCDFRRTTIKNANFIGADLTGGLFWETDTINWTLTRIKCSYAYWDKRGKQKTYYGNHDFERIYSDALSIELRYPFRLTANEISTLPILIEHLKASQWGTSIRLKSIQDQAGGSLVVLALDETGTYNPSELRDLLQREASAIQMAQITMHQDPKIQQELKEAIADIKETFWPRLLELAAENEQEQARNLTILFMDLKGFSQWKDEELTQKLALFRGLVKPILNRWNAGHPNMEGDSLRITFGNATIGLACACMLKNVLVGAGFELRVGVELGEVSIVHNVVTNQPDLEGTAVSMAARIESAGEPGEVLATEKVCHHTRHRGFFEFTPKQITLTKSVGNKKKGDVIECYSVELLKSPQDIH